LEAASAEPVVCKRLQKLAQIDADKKQRGFSQGYLQALTAAYRELTKAEPSADDAVALASLVNECEGLSNEDLAWLVHIETRFRKGEWPSALQEPPTSETVRSRLYEALVRYPRLPITLPTDALLRDKWLRVAVENPEYAKNPKAVIGPLLAQFYKENDTQEAYMALYQQLTLSNAGAWLARKLFDRLNLLPEAMFVTDTEPQTPPANLQRGPDDTLRFLGSLTGDKCAIALDATPLPPVWVRPCKGLKPRRFLAGELFLFAAEAKSDVGFPLHWLPVLVEESGELRFGETLRGKLDDRVLASFMIAAPRFVIGPKGLMPFGPPLNVTSASQGENGTPFASFRSALAGRPRVLAFSPQAKVKPEKACPKVDKDRCATVKGEGSCEMAAPACFTLGGAAIVRATPVRILRPLPCIKEYGEKSRCKAEEISGLFVDPIAEGSSDYTDGPFIVLNHHKPESALGSD
jgi:hypothetical protein